MSQENVEVVRQHYPGRIDWADAVDTQAVRPAFESWVHPDFETVVDPDYQMLLGGPDAATVAGGIDGFVSMLREWLSAWEKWVDPD
jgi:hypothetical protein